MWVLDYLDEIESDFSVFHGESDPFHALGSPRFFRLARQLPRYGGALAAALDADRATPAPAAPSPLVAPGSGGGQPQVIDDVQTVAAMTQAPGFPGIEFISGR